MSEFAQKVVASLADGTFVRLTLTRPAKPEPGLEKVLARAVNLKSGPHLSLTYRYPTRDVTKNIPVADAKQFVAQFRGGLLCTTARDWQLAGKRLITHKPSTSTPPARAHDVVKAGILDGSASDWLEGLGVVDATGKIRVAMADKYTQINRYIEIFSHLAKDCGWIENRELVFADMGCGKGYLTFGVWHLFHRVWRQPVHVIGVEAREELVKTTNALARQVGAAGLGFMAGTIQSVALPRVDALIALHACNTATDDAICRGIELGAKLIVVAPCCYQEVRPQMGKPEPLGAVLQHGLMAERMAEWATDGLRALYLEWAGYRTKMIEFVASEHTPKNLMIAAVREGEPFKSQVARDRILEFKSFFKIKQQALDELGRD